MPLPLFLAAIVVLPFLDVRIQFEPPFLLPALNVTFLTVISLIVAYLAAKNYLEGGSLAVTFLGSGMWVMGIASAIAAVFQYRGMDGYEVTVQSIGALLSGSFILTSALLSAARKSAGRSDEPVWLLPVTYLSSLCAMVLVTAAALDGSIPPFLSPDHEGTLLRQAAVIAAFLPFGISSALFGYLYWRSETRFLKWYSLGLGLIAVGLLGSLPEAHLGGAVSWAAKLAQYLGGVYILRAIFTVFRQFHTWGIPVGRALNELERRHRSLVEMCPDAILVHAEGKYVYANPAAARLFGARSTDEVVGRDVLELVAPGNRDHARLRIQQAYAGSITPLRETRFLRLDGQVIDVESTGAMVEFRGKSAIQLVVRDITERKRAEAVAARYQLISLHARDPLLLVALDGTIVEGNKAAVDFYGYCHDDLLRVKIHDLRRREDPETVSRQMQEARNAGILFETEHFRKDGTSVPVEVSSRAVVVDGQEMLLSVIRDITVRKQAMALLRESEEQLRRANEELDQRVQERTEQLSQTIDTLHEEVQRRTSAEHSLRERSEQLRLLASQLTLAEQRERQRLAQVLHDGLQQILVGAKFRLALMERSKTTDTRRATAEVADLIDDAIETSRSLTAELSPPILHDFGLVPALEWLARWMNDKHGLVLDLGTPGEIEPCGEDVTVLLFQATRELLFNVVKHAGVKSACVRVTRLDGQIRITVTDQGSGFDPADVRVSGGSSGGFGLFSVRERLSLMGGQMEIDSMPGRGSCITLIAPDRASDERGGSEPDRQELRVSVSVASPLSAAAAAQSRIRVLLVDDHIVMRQGLARLIQEAPDMAVIGEASDGESAIRMTRELLPDVVLMDISMPGMNGIQATRVIHAEMPDIRVIGLSMFEEGERAKAMRDAGAMAYVTKSGPADAVIAAIRSCASPAARRAVT